MKIVNTVKANLSIRSIAKQENKSTAEIRQALQEALDTAWSEVWTPGNIQAQVTWQRIFQTIRKPTIEESIIRLAAQLNAQTNR